MAERLNLNIVTPEGTLLSDADCAAAVLPVVDGSIGVLPRHAPMVAALRPGVLRYKQGGKYLPVAVSGGFAEVTGDSITVLTDSAELADQIDVLRARRAKERAEARLRKRAADVDEARARAALQRALTRLRTAGVQDDTGRG